MGTSGYEWDTTTTPSRSDVTAVTPVICGRRNWEDERWLRGVGWGWDWNGQGLESGMLRERMAPSYKVLMGKVTKY